MEQIGAVGFLADVEVWGMSVQNDSLVFGGETTLLQIQSSGSPQSEIHVHLYINTICISSSLCSPRLGQNRSIHLPSGTIPLQAQQCHKRNQVCQQTFLLGLKDLKKDISYRVIFKLRPLTCYSSHHTR